MPLEIDPTARISTLADIEDSIRGSVIRIGAHSVVDSFVKIKPAGGSGNVQIGNHVTVNAGCVLYSGHGLTIGDHVAIAAIAPSRPSITLLPIASAPFSSRAFSQAAAASPWRTMSGSARTVSFSTALSSTPAAWSGRAPW